VKFERSEYLKDASGWARLPLGVPEVPDSTGFSAISHGRSFKRPYSPSEHGVEQG